MSLLHVLVAWHQDSYSPGETVMHSYLHNVHACALLTVMQSFYHVSKLLHDKERGNTYTLFSRCFLCVLKPHTLCFQNLRVVLDNIKGLIGQLSLEIRGQ